MTVEFVLDEYIRKELVVARKNPILPGESLIDSGLLDSLTLLQLISFIEDRYGITVADKEMNRENFETINAMIALIQRKSGKPGG